MCTESVKSGYNEPKDNANLEWDALREALLTSEYELIPKKTRQGGKWMNDEILDMMKTGQQIVEI